MPTYSTAALDHPSKIVHLPIPVLIEATSHVMACGMVMLEHGMLCNHLSTPRNQGAWYPL